MAGETSSSGDKRPKRRIEREFGVPIAGEIVPEEQWTNTALKEAPAGPIDWESVFHRDAPVVVDIGCGNGRFLLSSTVWRPQFNHFGCDALPLVIRYATRRGNQRGLSHLKFAVIDGQTLLQRTAAGSIAELHLYHPQPYYDPGEHDLRLVTPAFLANIHRCLAPGGQLFLQTDHGAYWRYIREAASAFFELEERREPWPDAPKGRTRREIIALRSGFEVYRAIARPRVGLDATAAQKLVAKLPAPRFDADPSRRRLDALEKETG
jgi:tRNA (guanine-N7-)-methyltransferase